MNTQETLKRAIHVNRDEEGNLSVVSDDGDIEYEVSALDIDPEIFNYRGNEQYTPEQKIQTVMYYLTEGGKASRVAKKTGIKASTIRKWKSSAPWWGEVMKKCRAIKQDELDAAFTLVIHDTVDRIHERVLHGDVKLDKEGNLVAVPMSGKDLAYVANSLFDKRSLLRGDPTTLKKDVSTTDQLKAVEQKLLKAMEDAKERNVVSPVTPEFEDATEL